MQSWCVGNKYSVLKFFFHFQTRIFFSSFLSCFYFQRERLNANTKKITKASIKMQAKRKTFCVLHTFIYTSPADYKTHQMANSTYCLCFVKINKSCLYINFNCEAACAAVEVCENSHESFSEEKAWWIKDFDGRIRKTRKAIRPNKKQVEVIFLFSINWLCFMLLTQFGMYNWARSANDKSMRQSANNFAYK